MNYTDYIVSETDLAKIPAIECVYPLTAGLSGKILNKAVRIGIEKMPILPEWQDPAMTKRERWPDFQTALKTLHNPENEEDLQKTRLAKQRLAYDEMLANQLALSLVRQNMRRVAGRSIHGDGKIRKAVRDALPFSLTKAQIKVLKEINADMDSELRMLRLVQGDVGSGKTMVALFYNCMRLDIADNNMKAELCASILGNEFSEIGTGTNRIAFLHNGVVVKVALDRRG